MLTRLQGVTYGWRSSGKYMLAANVSDEGAFANPGNAKYSKDWICKVNLIHLTLEMSHVGMTFLFETVRINTDHYRSYDASKDQTQHAMIR